MGGKMPHATHFIKTMQDMAQSMIGSVGFSKALCQVMIRGIGVALCLDPLPQRPPLGLRLVVSHGYLCSGSWCGDRDDDRSSIDHAYTGERRVRPAVTLAWSSSGVRWIAGTIYRPMRAGRAQRLS